MQRDPSLIPLSHQHHNALALCVVTRRSLSAGETPANIEALSRRIVERYELELANHFDIEEQVLFPVCGALAPIEELLADHRMIGALVAELRSSPSAALLERFCELLARHIRREENELFQQVQETLPRHVLDEAGREIGRRADRLRL